MHGNDMQALANTLDVETQMIESLTLPPDPDGKNNDRAAWAMRAIRAFMAETGTAHIIATSDRLVTSGRV